MNASIFPSVCVTHMSNSVSLSDILRKRCRVSITTLLIRIKGKVVGVCTNSCLFFQACIFLLSLEQFWHPYWGQILTTEVALAFATFASDTLYTTDYCQNLKITFFYCINLILYSEYFHIFGLKNDISQASL